MKTGFSPNDFRYAYGYNIRNGLTQSPLRFQPLKESCYDSRKSIFTGFICLFVAAFCEVTLNEVIYSASGSLEPGTPSTFSSFALSRTIGGVEFYSQGSSFSFTIDAAADLSDGLQLSELTGTDPVFSFNVRELGTGRFHPALVQLNADGTGSIRNSNNEPTAGAPIDFGAEYITGLTFDPSSLTLVDTVSVPEPASANLLILIGGVVGIRRRR